MSKKDRTLLGSSLLGRLFRLAVLCALWGGIFIAVLFAWYAQELPEITRNANFERKASIIVKAANGEVIGRYGDIKGDNIRAENLPENLVYAVIAIEDRRFFSHWGIDFYGFARAMLVNIAHGRFVQGGSTITQQLAKNLFLSQERTIKRKIQEAMLAFWLEHELTKDEILSAYLNRVYMGSGTYGVDAATKLYFHKSVQNLSLREAATLAGLLKAPSRYSPLANPSLSRQRADVVIKSMVDAGYITDEEANAITNVPPVPVEKPSVGDSERYYTDWVVDSLQDLIGTPEEDIIVETTMDPSIQKVAENSLTKAIQENGLERQISQGAVIVMRPMGEVVAMVGGYNYTTNQFNRASQALRQPGSSFKPIVYLAALEAGYRPDDIVLDEPFKSGRYRPKNFGGEYYGEVTLETALMLSLNTVSVRLVKDMGPARVLDMAHRLGITSPLNNDLSQALGTNTLPPLEMTSVYAALANGGLAIHPYGITKITSAKTGTLYYMHRKPSERMRVVDPVYIDMLTGMMRSVIEYGTGQGAKLPVPAYGKTGTSQDSRDAWFIGFTPELVTGVWMGNDDNTPMKNVTGGSFPARVWRDVMASARGKYDAQRSGGGFMSSSGFSSLMDRLGSFESEPEQEPRQQEEIYFDGPRPESSDEFSNELSTREEIRWQRPRPREMQKIPESARYND
jgi:penicillin-binding protein 1A